MSMSGKRKPTYEQAMALEAGRRVARSNQRARVQARQEEAARAALPVPKSREELQAEREAEERASNERWCALEARRRAEEESL
jgi:hypothetical protein